MARNCLYDAPAVTNAIRMELPNRVQAIELHRALDTWEWIITAQIKGMEGRVEVRVHEIYSGSELITEAAKKLRVFC